jgi:2-oxoisovalerate dehydrogenase E2 component (dihydrolipoyl transacylase)
MTLLRTRSSPFVRRTAEEYGIDISAVAGTGTGGRVTKRDILTHIGDRGAAGEERKQVSSDPAPPPAMEPVTRRVPVTVYPGDEVFPVTPMRRSIAEHMVRSERTAPHATVVMEVDMTVAVAWRAARKEEFSRREGVELTYLPIVLKAVTLALADHPRLNAVWDEERIIHRKAINIGVAVALEDGLVVPVIRNAERLSLVGLAHAVAELAGKAREGKLAPDDLSGGTFTVNNPGTFGSLVSTPILVQPQVAILSTEAIIKRPVVVDDMIGIRSMMNLSLSIDHRALDGLAAARFLQQVKRWLESVNDDLPLY